MQRAWIPIVLGFSWLAACGGKVAFDGLPSGAGGSSSSHSTSQSVVVGVTTSVGPSGQSSVGDGVTTVGVTVVGSSGSGQSCGGFPTQGPACSACAQQSCCAELLACDVGTACFQLKGCSDSCNGNPNCQQKCNFAFPSGQADLNALDVCLSGNCPMECGGPPPPMGGICDSGLTTNDPKCDACMSQNCCKEADVCTGGMFGMNMQQVQKCIQDCSMMPPGPLCAPILNCEKMLCGC